jgi:uncharacterized protein (TIGR02271 family)
MISLLANNKPRFIIITNKKLNTMSQENINRKLQELGGSDYEIADGEPNIKGWDVKDENGRKFGKVKELLFDAAAGKVRYIILDVDGDDLSIEDRRVLVPIGIATLHEKDDDVILPGVTAVQLESLPKYEKDGLTPDGEQYIRNVFAGEGAAAAGSALAFKSGETEQDVFYDHEHFNQNNLYRNRNTENATETIPVIQEELQVGKREVKTGGLRLKSRVTSTPVQEDITLREEKIVVERTAVDRAANASDIKEEYVELKETAEVPVVTKEAYVVEEVSLDKEVNEKTETISDTVRNTEVNVEELGNRRVNS